MHEQLSDLRLNGPKFFAAILVASSVGAIAATATRHRDRAVTVEVGAMDPSVSPDGSTIAVSILGRIFLLSISGGEARPITSGNGWDASPTWAPNGRSLAYRHDEAVGSQIVSYNLERGAARTVYARSSRWGRSARELGRIAFHPTKPEILYVGTYGSEGLWSVSATGDSVRQIVRDDGRAGGLGVWATFGLSPDGRSAAVTRTNGASLASGIYTTPLDRIDFTPVALGDTLRAVRGGRPTVYHDVDHSSPQWSRDGKTLYYLERDSGIESLIAYDIAAKKMKRFKLGAFTGRQLALHPDGKTAVLASERKLFRLDLANGKTRPIGFRARFTLPPQDHADLVITNARLFDAVGTIVKSGATVEIRDGRISSITTGEKPVTSARGTRVIDAGGRLLMPGLADSHDHHWVSSYPSYQQAVAQGITTVLDLGSEPTETLNHRDMIAMGLMDGPHIYTVGRAFNGTGGSGDNTIVVTKLDAANEVVQTYKRMGIDALSLHPQLAIDVAAEIIAKAHDRPRIPVTGDVGRFGWPDAVTADIDGLAQFANYKWGFLSPEQRAGDLTAAANLWPDADSAEVDALFTRMAKGGFMLDPTILTPLCRRCPIEQMLTSRSQLFQNPGSSTDPVDSRLVRIFSRLMRQATQKQIPFLVGTDAGDFRAYVDNLLAYEAIGIPNAAILQAATVNLAKWLGKEQEFGTIQTGRRADLILVDGDPLARIADLRKITLVVKDGRVVAER